MSEVMFMSITHLSSRKQLLEVLSVVACVTLVCIIIVM